MRHDVGEFPVHFFGSNDYLWTYQARVFPYMDVDANSKEKMGKGVDATYKKGIPCVQQVLKVKCGVSLCRWLCLQFIPAMMT